MSEAAVAAAALAEKEAPAAAAAAASKSQPKKTSWGWGWKLGSKKPVASSDLEKGSTSTRPIRLFAPIYGGLGLGLSLCM